MGITRFAIERHRFTVVAIILLCVGGVLSYMNAPKDEDPGFTIRVAVVLTAYPGANPEEIEQLISIPLEDEIGEIPEVDLIQSESRTGASVIYVHVHQRYDDIEPIWDDLRVAVDRAAEDLPEAVIGPTVDDDFGDVYGTIVTLTGEDLTPGELEAYADDLGARIAETPEAAGVDLYGVQDQHVYVDYSQPRLNEYGLTPFDLQELIAAENIVLPAGEMFTDREHVMLGTTSSYESIRDIRRQLIPLPEQGDLVFLEEVADVSVAPEEPRPPVFRDTGERGIAVAVSLREGGEITRLDEDVRAVVEEFDRETPLGVQTSFVAEQAVHVEARVNEFIMNIIQAMVTIMGVMLLAIGVRMGLVVTSLVPVTILTTLLLYPVFDIGLDQVSLASIIIALGMLVDNSIVVAESTMTLVDEGKRPREAAIQSTRELGIPLLVASLIIAAAFLPSMSADHEMGDYAGPIFWGVSITLLSSWFLAMTMTPLLSAQYLRSGPPESGPQEEESLPQQTTSRVMQFYEHILRFFLRRTVLVILLLSGGLALAWLAMGLVPRQFFPENDRAVMTVELEQETGMSLETTEAVARSLESLYAEEFHGEEIENWAAFIGGGAPRFYLPIDPNPEQDEFAFFVINLDHREDADKIVQRTNEYMQHHHPEVRVDASPLMLGPPVDSDIEVRISGGDTAELRRYADEVRAHLAEHEGTYGIRDDWGTSIKQLTVDVDDRRAKAAGITDTEVAVSLQMDLVGLEISEFRGSEETIPITLRGRGNTQADETALESTLVYSEALGQSLPLAQVAEVDLEWMPPKIMRRDAEQTIAVQAELTDEYNAIAESERIERELAPVAAEWSPGFTYEMGGEAEATAEANEAILRELPLAGLVIALLLLAQFNSLRKTFIVLLTIPFGLIGVVFGMVVTGATFGVMTLLGVISLAGIVIKNAVVLLDRIRIELEEHRREPVDAIMTASRRRLRPILLTTATTIFGLLPLWFAASPLWESMTIAIIFGLAFSTLLTLGFVPAMYALLFGIDTRESLG